MNDTTIDYNAGIKDNSGRKYHYNFDVDVMHRFMIRSFEPLLKRGTCLELGSHKGAFTKRLIPFFGGSSMTCVDASSDAIAEARKTLSTGISFITSTFEHLVLPKRYDNVVMTHVLEHLSDPVGLLKRINDDWLEDDGRLFLVCPNANAPSRQIAVKMGLISHNSAVTASEAQHGHYITYALDTLERDVAASGLAVIHRSGIFFKAFANFQWDRLLETDIVSEAYLEGCFKLGQQYPDLCSSIFLVCCRSRTIGS